MVVRPHFTGGYLTAYQRPMCHSVYICFVVLSVYILLDSALGNRPFVAIKILYGNVRFGAGNGYHSGLRWQHFELIARVSNGRV